tara:strand:+ start:2556 stop:4262 length:1707 start_codon:yes stop_codon:yes gene_type:complete
MQEKIENKITNTQYEKLIAKTIDEKKIKEKSIVTGKVVSVEKDIVIIDVGLKSEGRIPVSEFTRPGQSLEINIGDKLEVFVENVDSINGETILSREKAIKQNSWNYLQESFTSNKVVKGIPFNKVKGGLSVDLDGVTAFLPGSQIDTRQIIKDTKELLNKPIDLMILKMDKYRGNIVVSRKAISDAEFEKQKDELLKNISEGSIIEGKVKNLTDYGAFIDLGGLDGLVHVTDISWTKINSPSELLQLGQKIKVKVLKFDQEQQRLSLGIKQLTDDPWEKINDSVKVDAVYKAKVQSVTDNNVGLIINDTYDGLISINELTWLKKPPHPSKIVSNNEQIEVKILEIDLEKKKLNCSLKQLKDNPWLKLTEKFNINDSLETEIVNVVDFGVFVKVLDEIDGMVHISDLSWNETECPKILQEYKKGDKVTVKILDINTEKERISLGIKQLINDPVQEYIDKFPLKTKVTGKITNVEEKGITLELNKKINGYIKKSNLSKEKSEQKTERFAVGENIDSLILSIDNKTRVINLSIKDLEIKDEKEALNKYGSSDSGASLGDILGSVLDKKKDS